MMKFITLHAPNLDDVYLFPTEGIIVQHDPNNEKQTLISVQGTDRLVVGDPEDIACQIERMFSPDEIETETAAKTAPEDDTPGAATSS